GKTPRNCSTNCSSASLSTSPTTICMACSLAEQARTHHARVVLVGVDELAGDALRAVAADLAGARVEDVHPVDLHPDLAALGGEDVDVGLAASPRIIRFDQFWSCWRTD
ncbi:MAG: hypothetical protein M3O34_00260, partial [Chloroflexota bacterium]|nr:hypothetical protein [Chloroflexota bacterium]